MISRKQGFTLLEILVAISIFAAVISLAYSSYNATFFIINSANAQTDTYSKAHIAMERIVEDLESFYPGKEILFKGTTETFGDYRADKLQFLSTAHVRLQPDSTSPGTVLISYTIEKDPNSETLLLYRTELSATDANENDGKKASGLLLCDNLLEVAFDYQNKDGENYENWGDEESEEDAPDLVTISLRFNDIEKEGAGILFQTGIRLPSAAK
jgi:prepilin-type N-terminal cleavage/methylation domain-containing protein